MRNTYYSSPKIIRWTNEEKQLVLQDVCKQLIDNPELSINNALHAAQYRVLPKHKRRDEMGGYSSWLNRDIINREIELIKIKSQESHVSNALRLNDQKEKTIPSVLIDLFQLADEYLTKKIETTVNGKINEALELVVLSNNSKSDNNSIEFNIDQERIYGMIRESLDQFIANQELKLIQETNADIINSAKDKKPLVILINLLPDQYNEIVSEFGEIYDIRNWVDGQDSISALKSLASRATKIYGMTDKMKHRVDKTVSNINLANYVRFSGGISTLKRLLNEHYCNS